MSDEIPPRPAPPSHGGGALGRLAHLAHVFYGDAERDQFTQPVRHLHDPLENEIDNQLRSIRVFTDATGKHYAVQIMPPAEPDPPGQLLSYRDYASHPLLPPED